MNGEEHTGHVVVGHCYRTDRLPRVTATCALVITAMTVLSVLAVITLQWVFLSCNEVQSSTVHPPLFGNAGPGPVHHVPDGSLEAVLPKVAGEIAVVMLYAPWSEHCRSIAAEFVKLARVYKDQVTFAAINCWKGSCASRLNPSQYPYFHLLHPSLSTSIQRGGVRFMSELAVMMERLLRPVRIIHSYKEMEETLLTNQNVATAYLHLSGQHGRHEYNTFLASAVQSLSQADEAILYAVVLNHTLARHLGFTGTNSVSLIQYLGYVQFYPHSLCCNSTLLRSWLLRYRRQLVSELRPDREDLSSLINSSSVLVLTLNLSGQERPTGLLALNSVARLYFDCEPMQEPTNPVCSSTGTSLDLSYCLKHQSLFCNLRLCCGHRSLTDWLRVMGMSIRSGCTCMRGSPFVGQASICCSRGRDQASCNNQSPCAPDVPWNTLRLKFDQYPSDVLHKRALLQIQGLSCRTNRTTTIMYLDVSRHPVIGEQLYGVKASAPWTLGLVSNQQETTSLLEETSLLSETVIAEFLLNHTRRVLPRHFRSRTRRFAPTEAPRAAGWEMGSVLDLSSVEFSRCVFDSKQYVMVFFYTPWCVLCSAFYQDLMQLTVVLGPSAFLLVYRFDVESQDLPQHLSIEKFPTILLYPAKRQVFKVDLVFLQAGISTWLV